MDNSQDEISVYHKIILLYLIPFFLVFHGCGKDYGSNITEKKPTPVSYELNQGLFTSPENWGIFERSGINAKNAWELSMGDRQVVVAIIDTGLDPNHPFIKKSLWTGYVDGKVVHGWDMITNSDFLEDDHGHGTHIAGIIAGQIDSDKRIAGVAPNVSIMPIRYYANKSPTSNLARSIQAMNFAVDHGAKIINYSGGGPEYSAEEYSAILHAREKGVLIVAAAGNEGRNCDEYKYYPANYYLDNIITVASLKQNGEILTSSNYSKTLVDVGAPGEEILSSLPGNQGGFGYMTGTSQATAFVSGVAALILSERPYLTPAQIRSIIMKTSDTNLSLSMKIGSGKVNAYMAVRQALKEGNDTAAARNLVLIPSLNRAPAKLPQSLSF